MPDWSHDLVLRALQDLDDPVGSLVRAFPGRAALGDQPDWLDAWFVELTRQFAEGKGPDPKTIVASAAQQGDLSLLAKPPVEASVRLISIHPLYFRGFRDTPEAIRLDADLVVFEGRNSSGKTSLSEAIEWVFTGQLSRRTSGEHGHPTELADCIANEFRPVGEDTSVQLTLSVDGEPLVLRRVLKKDYSLTATDSSLSELWANGSVVTTDRESELRDELLAGVHPILMQHNLRRFVHDDPSSRRRYFERLLRIDELTALVEKAVIGPTRLKQIDNPDGGTGLAALRSLASEIEKRPGSDEARWTAELRNLERIASHDVPVSLSMLLVEIAQSSFSAELKGTTGFSQCRDQLADAQKAQREARLPLLGDLEKARSQTSPSLEATSRALADFKSAVELVGKARDAAAAISATQQQLATVAEGLIEAGLINRNKKDKQLCPLCQDSSLTLRPERLAELTSWVPVAKAVDTAESRLQDARVRVGQTLNRVSEEASAVVPPKVLPEEVERQLSGASQRVAALTRASLRSAAKVREQAQSLTAAINDLADLVRKATTTTAGIDQQYEKVENAVASLVPVLSVHREDVGHLEEAVSAASRDDAAYRFREKWLDVGGLISSVGEDVAWEKAKILAKGALDGLRSGLIALRTEIIEDARRTFSREMTGIWNLLRSDSGAQFSKLRIPPARRRGYKLEFELKAKISDGKSDSEVDALRVFSESQVNVIGIAAYITRARLLGHKLLIFDDPVQSMDEEHFRSFTANLLHKLLDEGFQVTILTHSDTFARRIHDQHYHRQSYATVETRSSKRKGCYVVEGSRRVTERLKNARRTAADGDLQNAWRFIRLAIERLYTLAYARANDGFDPESWRNLSAEDMWNRGVDRIIEEAKPGFSKRLKEILDSTVAGAHDKAATSETEIVEAATDLATLLTPLRLGDG